MVAAYGAVRQRRGTPRPREEAYACACLLCTQRSTSRLGRYVLLPFHEGMPVAKLQSVKEDGSKSNGHP